MEPEIKKEAENYIDFKGLKIYLVILAGIVSGYVYLQTNGIRILQDSNTEHEGNQHIYGNGHHK